MATKFTQQERKQQRRAGDAGAVAGVVGGGAAGFQAVNAGQKLNRARGPLKGFHQASRAAGRGRVKSLATAARVAPAAFKGPRTRATVSNPLSGGMGRFMGGYVGAATGAAGGSAAADAHVKRKQMAKKEPVGKAKGYWERRQRNAYVGAGAGAAAGVGASRALHPVGRGAAAGLGAGAGLVAGAKLTRKKSPVKKSAFGVDHG